MSQKVNEAGIQVVRIRSLLEAQIKKFEALCIGGSDEQLQNAHNEASALLDSLLDASRKQGQLLLAEFRSKGPR